MYFRTRVSNADSSPPWNFNTSSASTIASPSLILPSIGRCMVDIVKRKERIGVLSRPSRRPARTYSDGDGYHRLWSAQTGRKIDAAMEGFSFSELILIVI